MYNRNQVIANKQKELRKINKELGNYNYKGNLDKMWESPYVDYDECVNFGKHGEKGHKIRSDINSLKRMNEAENNFNQNINLDDYRNKDGSFNVL